jgi:hypothetical protein
MSRWAELFLALSTPDTIDTFDTRSALPPLKVIMSPSVDKCRCRQHVK